MNMKVLVTLVLCLFISGIATADDVVAYDSSVTLENKDVNWDILTEDGISATVQYNASGDAFTWRAVGTVPNHAGEVAECYALIYYADEDNRFVNWGGANPGACIGTFQVDACTGEFDSGDQTIDLGINLPESPDLNIDPGDEYCGDPDDYAHTCGAKLWIVPCSDYDAPAMTAWNPGEYLFETDLIWYDDTDARNKEPHITIVETEDCYAAGEEITITVKVCDEDGIGDLNAMIVTANFSKYGVEDLVDLTMVNCENGNYDCICREYEGTVVIIKATVHECEDECGPRMFRPLLQTFEPEFSYLVVATDPAGDYDDKLQYVDVCPGPCDHMELRNYGDCGRDPAEELHTVALTELSHCNTEDYEMWWSHGNMFDAYMIRYKVHVYDEYGNHISGIGCEETCRDCCDGFTATLTGEDASIKYCEEDGSKITIINDNNPGKTALTVNCIGTNNIPALVQEVEFLMPVSSLDVTANVDVVMNCCERDAFVDIDAQILDLYSNPILMPRVDVTLYVNGVEYTEYEDRGEGYNGVQTDMNGVASFFDVCIENPVDKVTFRAEAECRQGSLILPVVEGPCDIEITSDTEYMVNHDECGEADSMTVTVQLLNDSELPFLYAGIDIDVKVLYDAQDCREGISTAYTTDADGSVTLEVPATQDNKTVTVCAKMPACNLRDSITIDIIEPELIALKLIAIEPIMIPFLPDDVQDYEVHCYNQRDLRMCCPDTTYEFAVDNETVCMWQGDYGYSYDGLDNRITAHAIGETDVNVSYRDIVDTITIVVEDPCDYVTCENECFEYDLYSMVCVDGICEQGELIEENCIACGYDPCEDVTCEDKCFGADLYSQICDGGDCVQGELIQANCPDCPGYDPCLDVECDDTICIGVDLYNMTCVDGECVVDTIIETNCLECGYVAPSSRKNSGGSGGGTYPLLVSVTNTTPVIDDPIPEADPDPEPEPTEKLPARPGSVTIVTDDGEEITVTVDEDGNWLPGFNGIFAVLGLLSIVYIMNRRRD